jgi:hypothetical protein
LTDTYTTDTGERYLNEGTHPTGAQTETGNYTIFNYASTNKGVYLNRIDANGNDVFDMFPPGFQFQLGGTAGSLRVSSTSGTGYTDYQWNYITTDEGAASPTNPQWFKFDMDNKPLPPTGQGSLYFTTTVTTASGVPTDGQVLTYVAANSQWEPASTSIQAASDFELNPGTFPYWATKELTGTPSAGEWFANGSSVMRANPVDSNGTDWTAEMTALGTSGTFWYSTDAISWTETTNSGGFDSLPSWFQFNLSPFNANSHAGGLYISFTDPASAPGAPLADGDILQYVAADSAFKPAAPAVTDAASARALLGISEWRSLGCPVL